ncbi:N-carbamoylputrescine amidase [Roseimicrobium gellanilyticum]|uniref:N-carbamoylputrescine amidase n=1 Tax=Roseimicrobium gellanilyticum TaxID=748857 RepID=A0A366HSN7_9BACT|nr:carbon-nitrogen hydrolase [Roseimicrobium gellanilyticum]RBP47282.1 N-carbamoylputrescine amidase [Roseimicrobium gellanilyticum]
MSSIINLGLIQTHATEDKADNLRRHIALIREAAKRGAHVVCLQELFLTPYFCKREDTALFDLADPIPGDTTKQLGDLARELGVVIIASMFEKRAIGLYHNTAAIIDADGEYMGKFRKMHIPEDPGFNEKFYFTPGDLGYKVWDTKRGRLGVLVCWDQWYPEAARLTAMSGAQILFYPTAIGWLKSEKAELGKAQHTAWETVQRGHAVANGCYVAAVNRVGVEEETEFWGQSFVANPYGEIVAKASPSDEEILMVPCDIKAMEDFRRIWPFFRDRRIDSYNDLTKRWRDDG